MVNTQTQPANADPADAPAAGSLAPVASGESTTPPEPPSIGDLLNWDVAEKGEIPEEHRSLLTPDAIRDFHTSEIERVRAEERQAIEAQSAAESAERQAREAQLGQIRTDIDFYQGIRAGLQSDDPDAKARALADWQGDEQRYMRGAAGALWQESQQSQQAREADRTEYLRSQFDAFTREADEAYRGVFPAIGSPEWNQKQAELAQFDGKGGYIAYAIEQGIRIGEERGRSSAAEEFERNGRIESGKQGVPAGGSFTDGSNRYGDRDWVNSQIQADPTWRLKPSGERDSYGRMMTNNDRVLQAMGR